MENFSSKDYSMSPKEACKLLRVTENTLRVWRRQGYGPTPIRIGKKLWYCERLIEDYLRGCWEKANRGAQ